MNFAIAFAAAAVAGLYLFIIWQCFRDDEW
jgi:hypothetical protein